MKYLLILALSVLGTLATQAQEKFDYDQTVALAFDRTQTKGPKDQIIFVLGPEQNEEFVVANGKESKRILPYYRAFLTGGNETMERLLGNKVPLSDQITYQIMVHRAHVPDPVLRIQGSADTLKQSQFPLKAGDVLVVTKTGTKK